MDLMVNRLSKKHLIKDSDADYVFELRDKSIIRHVAYGYLNKRIFAGMDDGRLLELDNELKLVKTHTPFQNEPINSITFSKKYEFIVLTSKSGTKMLDYETFELLIDHRSDHPMRCAQMSPIMYDSEKPMYHLIMGGGVDAHETATKSEGGLDIEIINAIQGNRCATVSGHFGPVNWIECFPDGSGIVTAGEEAMVRIYRFDKSYYELEKFQ